MSTRLPGNYREPDLPSERTNWAVVGGIALVVVIIAILLVVRYV